MITNKIFLSAADFINFEYCPRIIYFIYVLKKPQRISTKQKIGLEKDKQFIKTKRTKILKQNKNKLIKMYNVFLHSPYYGIATKIDCLAIDISNNLAYPIQLKNSYKPLKIYKTQKIQLLIEGFLIEEIFHYKVRYGFIKYLKSNTIIKVNIESKKVIFDLMKEIENIIKNEIFPEKTKYKKRCVDCCYRRFCYG